MFKGGQKATKHKCDLNTRVFIRVKDTGFQNMLARRIPTKNIYQPTKINSKLRKVKTVKNNSWKGYWIKSLLKIQAFYILRCTNVFLNKKYLKHDHFTHISVFFIYIFYISIDKPSVHESSLDFIYFRLNFFCGIAVTFIRTLFMHEWF